MEDAAASAAAESDARALEEVRDREARLEAALAEAQASVANMRRLHQASQSQLFTMQASPRAMCSASQAILSIIGSHLTASGSSAA